MNLTPDQEQTAIDALQLAERSYAGDAVFYQNTGKMGHARVAREKQTKATTLWQLILNTGDSLHVTEGPVGDEELPPVVATRRCPACFTWGHLHAPTCQYKDAGMRFHILFKP